MKPLFSMLLVLSLSPAWANSSEESVESRMGKILGELGAVLVECPAEEQEQGRYDHLVCARYDIGFTTVSASLDERLLSEGWNAEVGWTSKDDSDVRRYTLSETSVVVYTEGAFTNPKIVKHVPPRYPPKARDAREEGKVFVDVLVSKDGTVKKATVLRCTQPGFGFEEEVLRVVKMWRFEPGKKHGEVADLCITWIVDFTPVRWDATTRSSDASRACNR